MSFSERVRKSLVFKSTDVEEIIDMVWHRRLAAIATALVLDTGLRPDHVTWLSLTVGWMASGAYVATLTEHLPATTGYPLSALLMLVSVILDCMDGQLARAKGGGTRMGRILDGVVDAFVLAPFYLCIGIDVQLRFGWLAFLLVLVAALSTFMRTTVYDRVKAFYLAHTLPSAKADGVETMEEVHAEWEQIKKTGTLMEKFLMWMYVEGQLKYGRMFSGRSEDAKAEHEMTAEQMAAYRSQFAFSMRIISFMGLGTHMLVFYTSVFLMAWFPTATLLGQVLVAAVGIPLLVFAIVRSRAMARPQWNA